VINSVFTLFILIAASRPVNKNVSTGAVIRAKPGTEPGIHKLLANCHCGFGYLTSYNSVVKTQKSIVAETHVTWNHLLR